MSELYEFEEEEFSTQFNGQTVLRVLAQTRPHWPMVAGFLFCIILVASADIPGMAPITPGGKNLARSNPPSITRLSPIKE